MQFLSDFSLHMRISTIFLHSAEVLVTDSKSHTFISYSYVTVTAALPGLFLFL